VDDVDHQLELADLRRRVDRHGQARGRARGHGLRERRAQRRDLELGAVERAPAVPDGDLGLRVGPARPPGVAEVRDLDLHVVGGLGGHRADRVHEPHARGVRGGQDRAVLVEALHLGARGAERRPRAPAAAARARFAERREERAHRARVVRVHRREPKVLDVLGDEHVVDRRALVVGDPGPGALVPVGLRAPALGVAEQQHDVQQRRLGDPPGALDPDARMRLPGEAPDAALVAHEPHLDVALPHALRDRLVRGGMHPAAREPDVRQLALGEQRGQRLAQRPGSAAPTR
jgi:hypothetical protein